MTEKVDKTLIERLIIEHSDRLELEINQKARADAWKFYYRVRVDQVIRPFAVCKVCFRVLHCDSRSGTASLLRHPCNPLSERSPVNRAVKLTAKLNLPTDGVFKNSTPSIDGLFKNDQNKVINIKTESLHYNESNNSPTTRISPVSTSTGGFTTTTTNCPSPASTGSPPTAAQPSVSAALNLHQTNNNNNNVSNNNNTSRKRKSGAPQSGFPLDLRFLHIPQLIAAANPFSHLSTLFNDPQQMQQFQQQIQQSQLEHILREHQKQQQLHQHKIDEQEREAKRTRGGTPHSYDQSDSPGESSATNYILDSIRVKKEQEHTDSIQNYIDETRLSPIYGRGSRGEDPGGGNRSATPEPGLTKEAVQQLVTSGSSRITLAQKETGSHYISDVWTRFNVVYVDGQLRPFASCKTCQKVVTYTKYSGTGGLLRHRCSNDAIARQQEYENSIPEVHSKLHGSPPPPYTSRESNSPLNYKQTSTQSQYSETSFRRPISPLALSLIKRESDKLTSNNQTNEEQSSTSNNAMPGVARALLRYMCQDMVSSSSLDSPAFQQLVWTVLNLGAAHGTFRQEEPPLPSSEQLLESFLEPIVQDSRSLIAKNIQDLTHLSLSLHVRKINDENVHNSDLLAVSVHYITSDFQLKSHALGTQRLYPGDSLEHNVYTLLNDFFREVLPASSVREKHITVVRDESVSDIGSANVSCVWHAVESVLNDFKDLTFYKKLCSDIMPIYEKLREFGAENLVVLQKNEIVRWDGLLRALTCIIENYDKIKILEQRANSPRDIKDNDINTSPDLHKEYNSEESNPDNKEVYEEIAELLQGVRQCLLSVRDSTIPTLNQAVLCRAKLLQLCSSPGMSYTVQQMKDHLLSRLEEVFVPEPLHLVASFLDPRCKSLKVSYDNFVFF